jgi:ABC-2 type transport system permease protein
MLADGVDQLAWLAWFTPFGLAGKAAPYASDRIVPILVLALTALAVACIAVFTARIRDTGHGLLRLSTSRPPRTTLLGSLTRFAVRRAIGPTVGWTLAVTAYVLLIGTLISSITRFLAENPRFAELAAAAGFAGLGSPTGFAAAMFSLLTIPVGLFAASSPGEPRGGVAGRGLGAMGLGRGGRSRVGRGIRLLGQPSRQGRPAAAAQPAFAIEYPPVTSYSQTVSP